MLTDRVDYVLDHSASGPGGRAVERRPAAERGAAAQLLVLHDRRPRHVRRRLERIRRRPHPARERLPARRLHLARHARRCVARNDRAPAADDVGSITYGNAAELFRHPLPDSGAGNVGPVLDLLIRGARSSTAPARPAGVGDVGVRDGRIVAVGDVDDRAAKTVDATASSSRPASSTCTRTTTPSCSGTRRPARRSLHGVTTVFGGNCGFTLAPAAPDATPTTSRG